MLSVSRNALIALLLLFVLSNAAFAAHTATHVFGDVIECNLCLAHSPVSNALSGESQPSIPAVVCTLSGTAVSQVAIVRFVGSRVARGPPSDIQ